MKSKNLGLVLALSTLVVAGCATKPAPRPADTAPGAAADGVKKIKVLKELAGTSWVLVELDGREVPPPLPGWSPRSLEFGPEGLRITGNAGVNRFGARYEQYGSELKLGPLALTRRLGPEEILDGERLYTQLLSRVVAWRQDDERLVLISAGEKRAAVFERAK